jgi:hypothetical protein
MPEAQPVFLKTANGVSVPFLVVQDESGKYQLACTLLGAGEIKAIIDSAQINVDGALTIADGADVTKGSTTDVAVVGDVNGTISAKLRGLSKIFNSVWNASSWLKTQDQGTLATGVTQPTAGVGLTGLLSGLWGWVSGQLSTLSPKVTAAISGSIVLQTNQQTQNSPGTPVQIGAGASIPCSRIYVAAKVTNQGNVYLGGSNVSSVTGLILPPGLSEWFYNNNADLLWFDTDDAGDGISWKVE